MTSHGLSAEQERLRQSLLHDTAEHGHAVVDVAGDADGAPYTFSAGAWWSHGVPEAVVIGLPDGMGPVLIDSYVQRASAGQRFLPGGLYDDFFEAVPVTVEHVAKRHYGEFLGSALLLYPDGEFPAVQLIVATPDGAWPWQPTAPRGFAAWQPVLTNSGVPESWRPGVSGP